MMGNSHFSRSRRGVCVVLHDVAPATWEMYRDFVAAVDAIGRVPLTLLVVPDYHRRGGLDSYPDFCRLMDQRRARGDELVLHGCRHQDDLPLSWFFPRDLFMRRVFTHEGEFYLLTEQMARERLEYGLEQFKRLGWTTVGFVAPAWLMGYGTRKALASMPLRYTSDPGGLFLLPDFEKIPAPTLVWSSGTAWRRLASRLWNERRRRQHAKTPLLRLGLHPVDMQHESSRKYWLETLEKLLQSRLPTTKAAWLGLS